MQQIEDLLISLASDRTNLYGPRPIPDPIDDEVRELVRSVDEADWETRKVLFGLMNAHHGWVLLAFAERMASLAVRTGNPQNVSEGLEALAYGAQFIDLREAILIMSLLYRSATKLNLDAVVLFDEAARLGDADFAAVARTYPSREEHSRSIAAMGYIESDDHDGFRYVRTW